MQGTTMSLKPQPSRPLPEELARLGAILLPSDSPYRLIGDQLYALYDNAAFADLYHAEGKPALPPVDLLFVLAFQALEDLGDRAAADAVRLRLDWKYALHLPLDHAGFNFPVLSDFRTRLLTHDAAARPSTTSSGSCASWGCSSAVGASAPTVWPSSPASICSLASN